MEALLLALLVAVFTLKTLNAKSFQGKLDGCMWMDGGLHQ